MSEQVFISFGSNKGQTLEQILGAFKHIQALNGLTSFKASSIYKTPPMGPEQPDYLNGVCSFEYTKSPEELLIELQKIETLFGRDRKKEVRWGPRTLDLDLLMFGDIQQKTDFLQLPHPGLHERAFVLTPMAEIAPELVLPNGQKALSLASVLHDDSIKKVYTAQGESIENHN